MKTFNLLGFCAAAALLFNGTAAPAQPTDPSSIAAPASRSIKLVRVIAALPVGAPWLTLKGWLCVNTLFTETWTGGRAPQDLPPYSAAFKTELDRAGYKVVTPGEDNLFDPEAGAGDLQVAAVITDQKTEGCVRNLQANRTIGDVRGESSMQVDWQIYSPIQKQVVAHVSTSASAKLANSVPGGVQRLVNESFAANVRELAAKTEFRTALTAPNVVASNGTLQPGKQDKIGLPGSLKAAKRPIADTAGSIVTVLTGSGSGSAILVSADGYMLTNAHVVGDEKDVRIRWSDGIETAAQVIRSSKARDIALIKTNARDREPLAIKRGAVSPGARVYAIGSPKGKEFQGTVTSGVISASRLFDGLRFIQSDVAVSPGSSGGALLDENGALIGITDLGVDNGGRAGLNLFIPIGDAMDFLNLEQQ